MKRFECNPITHATNIRICPVSLVVLAFQVMGRQIVRFGETIAVTPSGSKGTPDKKWAVFFLAAGRRYGARSADASRNHLEPWLRTLFAGFPVRNH
jgi:hypothetical protein